MDSNEILLGLVLVEAAVLLILLFRYRQQRPNAISAHEAALEALRLRLAAVLRVIGEGVFVVNKNGRIELMNDAAVRMIGYTAEEAVGQYTWNVFRPTDDHGKPIPPDRLPVQRVIRNRTAVEIDGGMFFTRKDGNRFLIHLAASPYEVNGQLLGAVAVFRDITKEREIDRMKTEFVSVASHQLRTPLSAVRWFLELLLEDSDNLTEEQRDFIDLAKQSNDRMIKLVNDLLNLSRLETGRIIIEPKATNLAELIKSVIQENAVITKARNCTVEFDQPKKLPPIQIDPELIRQVMQNLISNAIKYSLGARCRVVIRLEAVKQEYRVTVTDFGVGIPENQQHRVFDKFFRGDNVVRMETEGTGLGLYITKLILEASGGRVGFTSKMGKGSIFWFTLPKQGSLKRAGEKRLEKVS